MDAAPRWQGAGGLEEVHDGLELADVVSGARGISGSRAIRFPHCGNGFLIRDLDGKRQAMVQFDLFKEEADRLGGGEANFLEDRFRGPHQPRIDARLGRRTIG
jgi:hypothetical protein